MTGLASQPVSPSQTSEGTICGNDQFPGGTGASFLSQAGGDSPQSGAVAAGYRHAERAILIARVCLAAIFACHEGFEGVTPGSRPLAMCFLKWVRQMRPVVKVAFWILALLSEAL